MSAGEQNPEENALPELREVLPNATEMLANLGHLGILVLDFAPMGEIEGDCGSEVYSHVLEQIAASTVKLRDKAIRSGDILCRIRPLGEQIAIFLEGPRRSSTLSAADLESTADRIFTTLEPEIAAILRPLGHTVAMRVGYTLVLANSMLQPERMVYRAIDRARLVGLDHWRRSQTRERERLRDLIVSNELRTFFQPLVELNGRRIRAYEALSRGPADSDIVSPLVLFQLAARNEVMGELDRACFQRACENSIGMPNDTLLFVNLLPNQLNDPGFRSFMLDSGQTGIPRDRLVLELSEGVSIRSYAMISKALDALRAEGIRVAVDDLGAGHSNLEQLLELQPDFLKLDISLVRGIDRNPAKQAVVAGIVAAAEQTHATVVAEGIEEAAEMEKLRSLGVAWGQGFLFARPSPGFVNVDEAA